MSWLGELKDTLASAGYSPEQIEDTEKNLIEMAVTSASSAEELARSTLDMLAICQAFKESMYVLEKNDGISADELQEVSQELAKLGNLPLQQAEKTEKVPYYQKNKQHWWK